MLAVPAGHIFAGVSLGHVRTVYRRQLLLGCGQRADRPLRRGRLQLWWRDVVKLHGLSDVAGRLRGLRRVWRRPLRAGQVRPLGRDQLLVY